MVPFFVVDRPVSLEILKGFFLMVPNKTFGILTHAFVSDNFKRKFLQFPYNTSLNYFLEKKLEDDRSLSRRVIKFADSGIFEANRQVSYEELFDIYEQLGAHYGVIIDFFKDKNRTIESAKHAIKVYQTNKYRFKLVGVAQGTCIDEYISCYKHLRELGYKYIALGGLLKRNGNSNYRGLRCEYFLQNLIERIKYEFDPNWLFVFGIFNPKRKALLERLNVWGADYKGWLFHYDESYSFIKSENYITHVNESRKIFLYTLLNYYSILKQKHKLSYSSRDSRSLIRLERKLLDKSLSKLGMSLQELRFRKVRDELYKIFK